MQKNTTNKLHSPDLKNAKPKDKLYRLRDGGGLYCDVLISGSMVWRYNYRLHGKQKSYTIGHYPAISLAEARTKRDTAKLSIKAGIDPSQQKQIAKRQIKENSFQAIAETWLAQMQSEWSDTHHTRLRSYLTRDAYPVIGDRAIDEILAPEIIPIIMAVSNRGAVDSAKRLKGMIQQVFDYALVHGKVSRNPAKDLNLSMLLPKTIKRHYATITDPEELGKLLRDIDGYQGGVVVKSALQVAPMLMARPSEISNGEWSEIDFETSTWTIPASRRKLPKHIKRANRSEDSHIIPLCSQAMAVLTNLYQYTGKGKYIFPSARGNSRPMSNNALRTGLRTMGYTNDQITAHGFRGVASTILNEQGYRTKVIESQLSHKLKSAVEGAYNHADYLEERRNMLNDWGDYLENLKQGADVIPIKRKA